MNASDSSGQTPLMFASISGREAMVEFLLAAGADPFAKDTSGKTPLNLAETQRAEGTVKRLREAMRK